jgi:hypothetical protein
MLAFLSRRLTRRRILSNVPNQAERLLFLVLPAKDQECEAGNLEEAFHHVAAKHGYRFARFWYWIQVVYFAGAQLLSLTERVVRLFRKTG